MQISAVQQKVKIRLSVFMVAKPIGIFRLCNGTGLKPASDGEPPQAKLMIVLSHDPLNFASFLTASANLCRHIPVTSFS